MISVCYKTGRGRFSLARPCPYTGLGGYFSSNACSPHPGPTCTYSLYGAPFVMIWFRQSIHNSSIDTTGDAWELGIGLKKC